jgi:hypothetical protein
MDANKRKWESGERGVGTKRKWKMEDDSGTETSNIEHRTLNVEWTAV